MRAMAVALAAAALCAAPMRAEAQFGRLKAKLEDKMADKAVKKTVGGEEIRASKVSFGGNVVELTETRLAAFVKGLAAQREARPRIAQEAAQADANYAAEQKAYDAKLAQYDRDFAAYTKAHDKWDACREEIDARARAEDEKRRPERERAQQEAEGSMDDAREARLQAIAAKMQEAQQRGDTKTMMAYRDSMQAELSGVMAAGQKSQRMAVEEEKRGKAWEAEFKAKCGAEPKAPTSPTPPQSSADIRAKLDSILVRGAGGAIDVGEAAIMRERIVGWQSARKNGTGAGSYVYTKEELAALAAFEKELEPYREQMANPEPWFVGKKG
jgi:hypothetical protein